MDHIQRALDEAQSGKYSDALKSIIAARKEDPRNIYLIGLEKRFAQLADADPERELLPEERGEIIDSLPGLVQRAIEDAQQRREKPPTPEPGSDPASSPLTVLKEQYFRHADACIRRGDYEAAHLEVRRVQILDPNDLVAKEYELKILQFEALEKKEDRITQELRPVLIPTDHLPEPPVVEERPPSYAGAENLMQTDPPIVKERKSRKMMLIGAVVFLAAVGGFFFFMSFSQDAPESPAVSNHTPAAVAQPVGQDSPATTMVQALEKSAQPPPDPSTTETPSRSPEKKEVVVAKTSQTVLPTDHAAESSVRKQTEVQKKEPDVKPPVQVTEAPAVQTPPANEKVADAAPSNSDGFVAVENPPQLVDLVKPKFPDILARNGIHGRVIAQVQIGPDGKPIQARVLKTTNSLYNDAVIEALMSSRYTPGMMSRGPVTSWLTIPFKFK